MYGDPDPTPEELEVSVRWYSYLGRDRDRERQLKFHKERCAICGRVGYLLEDHDHDSGLFRAFLCDSCNVLEGRSTYPIFDRYRERNPASILNVTWAYVDRRTGLPPDESWSLSREIKRIQSHPPAVIAELLGI
jgi:hypothetical protein